MKKKYNYTEEEQKRNTVLAHQQKTLSEISIPHVDEDAISDSEDLLQSLGYALPNPVSKPVVASERQTIVVPSWEQLLSSATTDVGQGGELTDFFSEQELKSNELYIRALASDFNAMHHLDLVDYSICAIAGILSGALDILMVGIPHATPDSLKAGPLSDLIRKGFDKKFPPEEMEKLANSSVSKVPFDAQDNRHTTVRVEGLSAYYHRMLSLGHDPLLGFVVGVFDCEGKDYMALAPDDGSDYVYIYEYKQVDDDNFTLHEIVGEDLWKKVAEEFSSIFDEEPGKTMS